MLEESTVCCYIMDICFSESTSSPSMRAAERHKKLCTPLYRYRSSSIYILLRHSMQAMAQNRIKRTCICFYLLLSTRSCGTYVLFFGKTLPRIAGKFNVIRSIDHRFEIWQWRSTSAGWKASKASSCAILPTGQFDFTPYPHTPPTLNILGWQQSILQTMETCIYCMLHNATWRFKIVSDFLNLSISSSDLLNFEFEVRGRNG